MKTQKSTIKKIDIDSLPYTNDMEVESISTNGLITLKRVTSINNIAVNENSSVTTSFTGNLKNGDMITLSNCEHYTNGSYKVTELITNAAFKLVNTDGEELNKTTNLDAQSIWPRDGTSLLSSNMTGRTATHIAKTYTNITITKVTGSGTGAIATVVTSETAVTSCLLYTSPSPRDS